MSSVTTIIYQAIEEHRARHPDRPVLIGVSGAQGSGKTHWCKLIEAANQGRIAHFSLDDVYFTRAEREEMARRFHPLFITRGPPGTHALGLAMNVFTALAAAGPDTETPLPRFDKARDDRAPASEWPRFKGKPEAILFDGWCLGALPDELGPAPLNRMEAEEDADGRWRAHVRADLADRYRMFFDRFDTLIYLHAPNWEIVRTWRGEQEEKLLGRELSAEQGAKLDRFLMHYERITRSMMVGGHRATAVVELDEKRRAV